MLGQKSGSFQHALDRQDHRYFRNMGMTDHGNARHSIVGIGGTLRAGSSTEKLVNAVLVHAKSRGANIRMFTGPELNFAMYEPGVTQRDPVVADFVAALRGASAIVVGSPGYHGGVSGLIKNALDYTEDMAGDGRPYFTGKPVGCVATGAGWQGANAAMIALRQITHSLKGVAHADRHRHKFA
jgi:FMN reductase